MRITSRLRHTNQGVGVDTLEERKMLSGSDSLGPNALLVNSNSQQPPLSSESSTQVDNSNVDSKLASKLVKKNGKIPPGLAKKVSFVSSPPPTTSVSSQVESSLEPSNDFLGFQSAEFETFTQLGPDQIGFQLDDQTAQTISTSQVRASENLEFFGLEQEQDSIGSLQHSIASESTSVFRSSQSVKTSGSSTLQPPEMDPLSGHVSKSNVQGQTGTNFHVANPPRSIENPDYSEQKQEIAGLSSQTSISTKKSSHLLSKLISITSESSAQKVQTNLDAESKLIVNGNYHSYVQLESREQSIGSEKSDVDNNNSGMESSISFELQPLDTAEEIHGESDGIQNWILMPHENSTRIDSLNEHSTKLNSFDSKTFNENLIDMRQKGAKELLGKSSAEQELETQYEDSQSRKVFRQFRSYLQSVSMIANSLTPKSAKQLNVTEYVFEHSPLLSANESSRLSIDQFQANDQACLNETEARNGFKKKQLDISSFQTTTKTVLASVVIGTGVLLKPLWSKVFVSSDQESGHKNGH